jgi:hypothetical protein
MISPEQNFLQFLLSIPGYRGEYISGSILVLRQDFMFTVNGQQEHFLSIAAI